MTAVLLLGGMLPGRVGGTKAAGLQKSGEDFVSLLVAFDADDDDNGTLDHLAPPLANRFAVETLLTLTAFTEPIAQPPPSIPPDLRPWTLVGTVVLVI